MGTGSAKRATLTVCPSPVRKAPSGTTASPPPTLTSRRAVAMSMVVAATSLMGILHSARVWSRRQLPASMRISGWRLSSAGLTLVRPTQGWVSGTAITRSSSHRGSLIKRSMLSSKATRPRSISPQASASRMSGVVISRNSEILPKSAILAALGTPLATDSAR